MWPLLEHGDTVLIHSSIMRALLKFRTSQRIIESLLEAVGERGTLLFPVFFFGFCEGMDFDIRSTPSGTGLLSETARKMEGAVRSGNPIYGFAVLGANKYEFDVDNYHALGSGSPFDLLIQMDGKVAALDVDDQHCMTIYHHIEKMENAPHRYDKRFSGWYTDWTGYTTRKEYSYFVRRLDVQTWLAPMEKILWSKGVYRGCYPFTGNGMRVGWARDIYNATAEVLEANGGENVLWRRNAIEKR